VKGYIDNYVHLWSCIRNVNTTSDSLGGPGTRLPWPAAMPVVERNVNGGRCHGRRGDHNGGIATVKMLWMFKVSRHKR
jgi:hypothetical protein